MMFLASWVCMVSLQGLHLISWYLSDLWVCCICMLHWSTSTLPDTPTGVGSWCLAYRCGLTSPNMHSDIRVNSSYLLGQSLFSLVNTDEIKSILLLHVYSVSHNNELNVFLKKKTKHSSRCWSCFFPLGSTMTKWLVLTLWMIPALWMYCRNRETEAFILHQYPIFMLWLVVLCIFNMVGFINVCLLALWAQFLTTAVEFNQRTVLSGVTNILYFNMMMMIYTALSLHIWLIYITHPESTEHLVDQKLDFIFWEITSHLGQVSKHVRHHQVAAERSEHSESKMITSAQQSQRNRTHLFSQDHS